MSNCDMGLPKLLQDKGNFFTGNAAVPGTYENMEHQRENVLISSKAVGGCRNIFILDMPRNNHGSNEALAMQSALISASIVHGMYRPDKKLLEAVADKKSRAVKGSSAEKSESGLGELNRMFMRYERQNAAGTNRDDVENGENRKILRFMKIFLKQEEEKDGVTYRYENGVGEWISPKKINTQVDKSDIFLTDETGNEKQLFFALDMIKSENIYIYRPGGCSDYIRKVLEFEYGAYEIRVKAPENAYFSRLLERELESIGYVLPDGIDEDELICRLRRYRGDRFSDGDIRIFVDNALRNMIDAGRTQLAERDFQLEFADKSAQQLLDELIGLDNVKKQVRSYSNMARFDMIRSSHSDISRNMFFVGNPGTAKSTVARLVSDILSDNGVTNGRFKSVCRSDMTGKYIGHTEEKMRELFESVKGGVLFVDEAGTLLNDDSFTQVVVKEFIRFMENEKSTIVIFAGYQDEMEKLFMADSGFRSRISTIIRFDSYSNDELVRILEYIAKNDGIELEMSAAVRRELGDYFDFMRRANPKTFANGRDVRNLYVKVKDNFVEKLFVKEKKCNTVSDFNEYIAKSTRIDEEYISDTIRKLRNDECSCRTERRMGFGIE